MAFEVNRAAVHLEMPGDEVEKRRLAGAVGADDGVLFALFEIDRDVADGDEALEILEGVFSLQDRFSFHGSGLAQ